MRRPWLTFRPPAKGAMAAASTPLRQSGTITVSRLACALAVASIGCTGIPLTVEAANTPAAGTLSLVQENDLFNRTDRNYTSGVQVSWVPPESTPPGRAVKVAHQIPWFPRGGQISHGYLIGQSIFTPHDITLPDPPQDDRPYAGWLYGAVVLNSETGQQLDQVALTVGVVGPAAMAEQSQELFHRITGSVEPRGWDTQLGNELGIVGSYQRSWRGASTHPLNGLTLDLTPHLGAALGNVFTYANTGLTMRIGKQMPRDFGPPRIQPSIPGSSIYLPQGGPFSWYMFGGIEGRAVARNIFLDGNTFRDSRSVEKKPLVGDLQIGVVLDWRKARMSYTHVWRTREFENQRQNDIFGVVTLTLLFPN